MERRNNQQRFNYYYSKSASTFITITQAEDYSGLSAQFLKSLTEKNLLSYADAEGKYYREKDIYNLIRKLKVANAKLVVTFSININ